MLSRDHIMRQVQELARAIARLMQLRTEGRHEEAHAAAARSLDDLFGLDEGSLATASAQRLLASAGGGVPPAWERVLGLAELLAERGETARALGRPDEAEQSFRLALGLYEAAVADGRAALPWDVGRRTARLRDALRDG